MEEKDEQTVNFTINGNTISNADLGLFLNNLRKQTNFREVNLASINFDNEAIVFSITGTRNKQ